MAIALEPAARFTDAELAAVFTAGYEAYEVPLAVDEAGFRFMADAWDYDLELSRVAVVDGESVGICTAAVRGDAGWIGGLGVALPHRSKGIGAVLMRRVIADARDRGLRRLRLEVLARNEPAIRLYERLRFEHVRELEVWALDDLGADRQALPAVGLEDALGHEQEPPWQRADASVRKAGGAEALGDGRGVLVYRRTGSTASVLQCAAADPEAAAALLRALPAEVASVRWVNGPVGHPLNAALAALGASCTNRQHELLLAL